MHKQLPKQQELAEVEAKGSDAWMNQGRMGIWSRAKLGYLKTVGETSLNIDTFMEIVTYSALYLFIFFVAVLCAKIMPWYLWKGTHQNWESVWTRSLNRGCVAILSLRRLLDQQHQKNRKGHHRANYSGSTTFCGQVATCLRSRRWFHHRTGWLCTDAGRGAIARNCSSCCATRRFCCKASQ